MYELSRQVENVAGHEITLCGLADFAQSAVVVDRHASHLPLERRVDLSPMFGVIWPACRALATRVATDPKLPGASVLELACGLALPSLIAARRGARVLATDQHPDTEAFLRRNLEVNGLDVPYRHLDLRDPPDLPRFDRVIASDVLYARELPDLVAAAFARWLAPSGVGWLADPGRAWLPELLEACESLGLHVEDEVTDDDIWLLSLRRR